MIHWLLSDEGLRLLRRVGVVVASAGLFLLGVAMLVLPGPGLLTMAAAVGLLSTEFESLARRRREVVQLYRRWKVTRTAA